MPINGRVYDFESAQIAMLGGRVQQDLTSIDYSDQVEKKHAHAISSLRPRGIGRGGYTASGRLKMLREGFRELLAQLRAEKKKLYEVQFEVTASYGDDVDGAEGTLMTDELPLCEFTKASATLAEQATSAEIDLDFIIIEPIVWDGVESV